MNEEKLQSENSPLPPADCRLPTTVRLIVCDIEGCVTPPRRDVMELSALAPLAEYCREARRDPVLPPLIFCTGRQIPYAECVAQMLGAFYPGFPSIVENGAFLYDIASNEILRHPLITDEALSTLEQVRAQCRALMERTGAAQELGKEVCLSLNPPAGTTIESLYQSTCEVLAPWSEALVITHSQSAVDITPRGLDKAAGVLWLSQRVGIAPDEMLGIGDTRGDLPMLRLVGVPCGPANASAEVREVSTYIATHEGPRGVAEILEKYTPWRA